MVITGVMDANAKFSKRCDFTGFTRNKGNGNVHVINLAKTFVDLKRNSKFSFYFANRY